MQVRMVLRGKVGKITLRCRDRGGPQGVSLLEEEVVELNMGPGPYSDLAFEGLPTRDLFMHALLPSLRVHAIDESGNFTRGPSMGGEYEVSQACLARLGLCTEVVVHKRGHACTASYSNNPLRRRIFSGHSRHTPKLCFSESAHGQHSGHPQHTTGVASQ